MTYAIFDLPSWYARCRCYARFLTPDVQFYLRYGSHALDCPLYRPSGDPVDRAADEEFRAAAQFPPVETKELGT